MPCLKTSRQSLASTKWWDPAYCIGSSAKCSGAIMSLIPGIRSEDACDARQTLNQKKPAPAMGTVNSFFASWVSFQAARPHASIWREREPRSR